MDRALGLEHDGEWRRIIGRAHWLDALLLAWADDLDAARARLVALHTDASEQSDEHALPYILNWLGRLECYAGNFRRAQDHVAESYEATVQGGQDSERVFVLATRALVDAHLGREDSARA